MVDSTIEKKKLPESFHLNGHTLFSNTAWCNYLRFKEVSAVHKEVSRLVRIHPTAVSGLPEAIQV